MQDASTQSTPNSSNNDDDDDDDNDDDDDDDDDDDNDDDSQLGFISPSYSPGRRSARGGAGTWR